MSAEVVENARSHQGIDLLRVPGLKRMALWWGFPYVFQLALLVVFVCLATIGWGVHTPAGVNAKLFAKTHLTTLLVWGVWWPSMVWIAVLLGRVWCMVCPLELVSNIGERMARLLHLPQRTLPRWIASGVLIVGLYALIQMLVCGIQIHRIPAYTAWFLIGLLAMALLTALIFKDRAFCRGFCPVGLLLGTYGRGGMLAVRAGPAEVCKGCGGRECIAERCRNQPDARSCPSLLNVPKLASNKDCLVCVQCVKACGPDNMRLLLRRPFPGSDIREPLASWPVTLFVMVVSGFVTSELFSEWHVGEDAFLAAPKWFASVIGMPAAAGWATGIWSLAVVPLLLWSLLAFAMRITGDGRRLPLIWRSLALPLAVLVSAGHMSKGLAKFVSWSPFLPGSLHDPSGHRTVVAITGKLVSAPTAWLGISQVAWIALALLGSAWFFAVREYRIANRGAHGNGRAAVPLALLALGFGFIVTKWFAP